MMRKWRGKVSLALVLLLLALVTPISAQVIPHENAPWLIVRKLTVRTTSAFTGAVTTSDDVTVGDDLAVTDDTVFGGDVTLTPASMLTVTANSTLTPLGAYQPISSTGSVGTATITVGAAGKTLLLTNVANTTITFTDTGTLKLSGNIALGQYDTLILVSDGTNWIQRSTSNN